MTTLRRDPDDDGLLTTRDFVILAVAAVAAVLVGLGAGTAGPGAGIGAGIATFFTVAMAMNSLIRR